MLRPEKEVGKFIGASFDLITFKRVRFLLSITLINFKNVSKSKSTSSRKNNSYKF